MPSAAVPSSGTEVLDLPLDALADSPFQVKRYDDARVCDLAETIRKAGLLQTEGRRTSTEAALATVAAIAPSRVRFRVFTPLKALAYLHDLLPPAPEIVAPAPLVDAPFFGAEEHRTVNAFVLESTAALAQANAALKRAGVPELPDPPSTARMLALLKRVRGAVPRTRSVRG